jgi:type IV pilus assembly protein PilV
MFRASAYQGVAMIEVLIAALVITSSTVALLQMQLSALRQVYRADSRQQLLWLADDLAERVRSNPVGFRTLDLASSSQSSDQYCRKSSPCSVNDFARWQFDDWHATLLVAIPDGKFHISRINNRQASEIWRLTIVGPGNQGTDRAEELVLEFTL